MSEKAQPTVDTRYTRSGVRMRLHSTTERRLNWLLLPGGPADDRIVSQCGWAAAAYDTPNVIARAVPHAGHFPWIDQPTAVATALRELAARVLES